MTQLIVNATPHQAIAPHFAAMGNVCGAEAPVNESDVQLTDGKKPAMPAPGLHRSMSNVQVTELIDALVSTALPLVRKMISKKLIHQGLIVKNEEPVENFNPLDMPFEPFTGLGSTARAKRRALSLLP